MTNTPKFRIYIRLIIPFLLLSNTLFAQNEDSTFSKLNTFSGAVTIQSKGISTIPNLTLGKPAVVFDMKVGRKLTFEPQFRFALEGKPWAIVFWWRYNTSISDKFRLTLSTNHSLSYKTITTITDTLSGISQEIIRTTRYLAGVVAPNYQFNKYIGVGMYLFYTHGIEKFITQNTYMVSLRPTISNIPITKNIVGRVSPDLYYLKMDNNDGMFFTTRFLVSKNNYPLSISGLINKRLKSSIPSEYDFLWNVGLTYTFNNKYMKI